MALRIKEPKAGDWDYDGACAIPANMVYHGWVTFSVGIFQWVPRSGGKGIKRGKVMQRIRGYCGNPQEVYDRAEAYIREYLTRDIVRTE